MSKDNNDDNGQKVFPFAVIDGVGSVSNVAKEPEPTEFDYVIRTRDGEEYFERGFCIFTSAHVAIMKELGPQTAMPLVIVPLDNLQVCFHVPEDDQG